MFLYTFIMTYLEGIYISQVYAEGEIQAMRKWIRKLDVKSIEGFTEIDRQKIIADDFSDETPVLIKECSNVWCFGVRTNKELTLINFVKTETA